ncbi:MAG: hypothetical protein GKC10_04790 [Methanosarcinales archaeon]|nr:hypothetical protein [Methanosarcinales archaeon]
MSRGLAKLEVAAVLLLAAMCMVSTVFGFDVRGPVAEVVDGAGYSWDANSFPGFYFDTDEGIGTETLNVTVSGNQLEADTGVVYQSRARRERFEYEGWGAYYTMGFLGEKYFAGYADGLLFNKSSDPSLLSNERISRVLLDSDEEQTITSDSPLRLAGGFLLQIKDIDQAGDKVYLDLYRDGLWEDSAVIEPSATGAGVDNRTFIHKAALGGGKEIVVIAVHFKNAFRSGEENVADVDGIWQISEDDVLFLKAGRRYDKMTIDGVSSGNMTLTMTNKDSAISLNRNKDIPLMEGFGIKTSNQNRITAENPLRFYVYRSVTD